MFTAACIMFLKHIPLGFFTLLAWQMAVQTSVGSGQKAEDEATEPTPWLINIIDWSSVLLSDSWPRKHRGHIPVRHNGSDRQSVSRSSRFDSRLFQKSNNKFISSWPLYSLQISRTALENSQVGTDPDAILGCQANTSEEGIKPRKKKLIR